MIEMNFVAEKIPQALQTLGLLVTALGCCHAQFTRKGGLNYFMTSGYYGKTGINLPGFLNQTFMAHDHEVDGMKPKRGEVVVLVPVGSTVDKVLVKNDEIVTADALKEGEKIEKTEFIHNHKRGTGLIGPWEY